MLSVIAQGETALRAERQREGSRKRRVPGGQLGRRKALTRAQAEALRGLQAEGVTLAALRQRYDIGTTALDRYRGGGAFLRSAQVDVPPPPALSPAPQNETSPLILGVWQWVRCRGVRGLSD
jgi:hypothetical protein